MYLSAERVAIVNRTIQQTFEQSCIAWQAIPHWDTGDPGQTEVTNDNLGTVKILAAAKPVGVTLAQLTAPTPDSLLAKITGAVVDLAAAVDSVVFPQLRNSVLAPSVFNFTTTAPNDILSALIEGRVSVETAGFRAPSCLFAAKSTIKDLHQLFGGYAPVKDALLDAGNVNSLYRVSDLGLPVAGGFIPKAQPTVRGILLGRRQRIAPGYAPEALPGDEPVDLAVSIPPSFEVIGETAPNTIGLNVRIGYALRVKTAGGLVVFSGP
ncbi:hypothetical protein ACXPWS_24835 [Mycobacterium sp. BMJ-28]